jgi:putative MATE family efflux protein
MEERNRMNARMRLFSDPLTGPEVRSLYARIFRLAWPVFFGQLMVAGIAFLCRMIVADLQDQAYNGINLALMFFLVVFTVVTAMGVGTTSLVAQRWGAGDREQAGRILQQSIAFGLLGSLLLAGISVPAGFLFFRLMGVDAQTASVGTTFLIWLAPALPLAAPGIFVAMGLVGSGDTKTPMIAAGVTGVSCLVLAYGLVLGKLGLPRLEAVGAAVAIGASALVLSLFLLLFARRRTALKPPLRGWRPDWRIFFEVLKIGLPTALDRIVIQLGFLVFIRVINEYGDAATAGFFTGFAVFTLARTPLLGLQTAGMTLVGQEKGAGRQERAESVFRHCALLGFCGMILLAAAAYLVATPAVLSVFFPKLSAGSIGCARMFIAVMLLTLPLMGVTFVVSGGLRGAGHALPPLCASLAGVWGGRVLLAYALYALLDPPFFVILLCGPADHLLRILVLFFPLRRGGWKK